MKVKELLDIISKYKEDNIDVNIDNFDVVVDTEARRFNAHYIDTTGAFLMTAEEIGYDLLVLIPDFSGTES